MAAGFAITGRDASALLGAASLAAAIACGHALAADAPAGSERVACVDPKATLALSDPDIAARHSRRWRASVARHGRCFTIPPGEQWERLAQSNSLALMRKVPPEPGLPPLYFRIGALPDSPSRLNVAPKQDRAPGNPGAVAAQAASGSGYGAAGIVTQILPPLSATRIRGETPSASSAPAVFQPFVAPAPAAPAAGMAVDPPFGIVAPAVLPEAGQSNSVASARGYAIGFALAILLIVLLLAALGLLTCMLLRRSPKAEGAMAGDDFPGAGSMLRPAVPFAAERIRASFSRPAMRQSLAGALLGGTRAPPTPRAASPPISAAPAAPVPAPQQENCAALLREAGWEARVLPGSDHRRADVLARRDGRIMALRCLPADSPVDEQQVEEACVAREREQADLAVIVSGAPLTRRARLLAARTGVELLRIHQLREFFA